MNGTNGLSDEIWKTETGSSDRLIFLMELFRRGNRTARSPGNWRLRYDRFSPDRLDPKVGSGHGGQTREQE
jgi:hypothetical protein